MTVIAPRDWRAQRWANGKGVTHELVRWPAARISVAELAERAEFSHFAGRERWIAPLGRVRLTVDGVAHELALGDALRFSGEASVVGEPLAGPLRELNLIADHDVAWEAHIARADCEVPAGGFVFVMQGVATLAGRPLALHDSTLAGGALGVPPGALVAVIGFGRDLGPRVQ